MAILNKIDFALLADDSLKTLKNEIQKELDLRREVKKEYLIKNLKTAWTALEEAGIDIKNENEVYDLSFDDLTFYYK